MIAPGNTKVCPVITRVRDGVREILAFQHPVAGHQIVKGTLEPGEVPDRAALRELEEESGLCRAAIQAKIGEVEVPAYGQYWHVYACQTNERIPEAWDFFAQEDGGKWFRFFWVPLASLPTADWIDQFYPVLALLQGWYD